MRAVIKILFIFHFVVFSLNISCVRANDHTVVANKHATNQVSVRDNIELLAGLPKPPFIIDKNGAGLQLDIIRQAFSSVNHSVSFFHVPLGRAITSFTRFNTDGIAILPMDYQRAGIYVSKPYINYQNVAVSLSDQNFTFDDVEDLKEKSVIAFQNAKQFLGDDFYAAVSLSKSYWEIADQIQQIEMLFSRRTEVIILDVNIFKFFVKSHVGGHYNQAFTLHYIFDEHEYAAGFKSAQHRDMFDQGIALIKAQGIYQRVVDRYLQ